jgi:dihydrolipoamide dehydrogenase
MPQTQYDIVIVGGGPGGYTAAIRAAQLGMQAAIVERDRLGGVCLNWGCIPTKALLRNAEILSLFQHADEWGITFENLRVDFPRIIKRSRGVADRVSKGVEYLMKKNSVTVIPGTARLLSADTVEVRAKGSTTFSIKAKHIILATGARPRPLPNVPFDRKRILTSTEAMTLSELPASMVIVGAGAIGVEFASFYAALGTRVTLVEMLPSILPMEDAELTKLLASSLKKRGIEILTGSRVERAQADEKSVTVQVEGPDGARSLPADVALVAIGVQGNVEQLGLETLGVRFERGRCIVDKHYRTNVPGVYAIGDVIGPPWLAHVATAEAISCVEAIAGRETAGVDYANVPGCTYCTPQLASVGFTEEMAKAEGHEVRVGRFPFRPLGKAMAIGETEGMVKLVFDARYGELLGAHILGADATELIAEAVLARKLEATGPDLYRTIHAHPTLSEAFMEAAAAAYGEAISI